ncbi:Xaa-Pro aminopeptidase [Sphingomonas antarctica]|uniref:M24 family metallopeptidase n=1 Tax=Sphingomonas antarctica TaxID=2040274 RepID=UPI0039E8BC39
MINRRHAITSGLTLAALAALPTAALADTLPPAIGRDERLRRLDKARGLMRQNGIGVVVIEPGSSLDYFTGVQWWRSERITAALIFASGDPVIVTPFFEKPSVSQTLGIPASVRTWNEDESPIALMASIIRERRAAGAVGIEETVRFFINDGLGKALPGTKLVSANPVVRGCRMIKSASELALMQAASDITIAAIGATMTQVRVGMTPDDINAILTREHQSRGGSGGDGLVLLGEAAAYPHGSHAPQHVAEREIILIDVGCTVHGYQSDISRSYVLGGPTPDQQKVFDQVRRGQQIAMTTARVGVAAGAVDDAVRHQYEAWGYGPGYALPGTSHRTGHGIGMDGHEPVNLVHGEATKLAAGMCFSNEPGIYVPGKFGIRVEDCFHITAAGPKWFSIPQETLAYSG